MDARTKLLAIGKVYYADAKAGVATDEEVASVFPGDDLVEGRPHVRFQRQARRDPPLACRLHAPVPGLPAQAPAPREVDRLRQLGVVLGGGGGASVRLLPRVRGRGVRPHPGPERLAASHLDLAVDEVAHLRAVQGPLDRLVLRHLARRRERQEEHEQRGTPMDPRSCARPA